MGYFNFDIDNSAKFYYGTKTTRSTRDLLKITDARPRWKTPDAIAPAAGSDRRVAAQSRTPRSIRQHDTHQPVVNCCLVHKDNSVYRNFKISTARSGQAGWVAYFERLDGHPVFWEGTGRSMVRTASYGSQSLAIADAQISIDDLLASEPSVHP